MTSKLFTTIVLFSIMATSSAQLTMSAFENTVLAPDTKSYDHWHPEQLADASDNLMIAQTFPSSVTKADFASSGSRSLAFRVYPVNCPELNAQFFFCEIESRLERKSRIPVRFRLGSLDYVNRLEGKE